MGPSPTLCGMATRTLKLKYDHQGGAIGLKREIYCVSKNSREIYYTYEDAAAAEEAAPVAAEQSKAAPVAVVAQAPPPPQTIAASSGPAASVADEPLKAIDTLRVIIAQKMKKAVADISLSKSIKDLVGGKSTLQNEILGDLQAEFSSAPEKGEEMPLEELGGALNVGYSGTLGRYTTGLVSRMVGGKLPGGFGLSAVKAHLSKQWGLRPGRTDGALLIALIMEPAKRLGSEGDTKACLDTVAQAYAQQSGITLSSGGGVAASGGSSGGAVVDCLSFSTIQSA